MASRHLLFTVLYRLGFTPWDGHPHAASLRELVDGLPAGAALDVGCGTGDTSIYLAQHGWRVTGVDFVPRAVDKAVAKARGAGVTVTFRRADATRLRAEGITPPFDLIVDSGCLHGMSDDDRTRYADEITAVAAPDARLLLVEFLPGGSRGVPGIDKAEIERRFTPGWTLLASGAEPDAANRNGDTLQHYLFRRRNA